MFNRILCSVVVLFLALFVSQSTLAQNTPAIRITLTVEAGGNPFHLLIENGTGDPNAKFLTGSAVFTVGRSTTVTYTFRNSACNGQQDIDIAGTFEWSGGSWRVPAFKCVGGDSRIIFDNLGAGIPPTTNSGGQAPASAPVIQTQAQVGQCVTTATGSNVNIRTGPGTNYSTSGFYLSSGQGLQVIAVQSGWYRVSPPVGYNQAEAWVAASVTTVSGCTSGTPAQQNPVAPPASPASCWADTGVGILVGGNVPGVYGFDAGTVSRLAQFVQSATGGVLPRTVYVFYVNSLAEAQAITPQMNPNAVATYTSNGVSLTADGCGLQQGSGQAGIVIIRGAVGSAAGTFSSLSHEMAHAYGAVHGTLSHPDATDATAVMGVADAYWWSNIGGHAYQGNCYDAVDQNSCTNLRNSVFR